MSEAHSPSCRCGAHENAPPAGGLGPAQFNIAHTPRLLARGLIRLYQLTLSPLVGMHCRHLPTCSAYADEAIGRFGLWAGGWMTLARLLRCQPWGTSGLDFVPPAAPMGARWWLPWRYARWRGTQQN